MIARESPTTYVYSPYLQLSGIGNFNSKTPPGKNYKKQIARIFVKKRIQFDANGYLKPVGHKLNTLYTMDLAEWNFLFSTTRRNLNTGKKHKKGFIQLNF